jgi:hypothetical protein
MDTMHPADTTKAEDEKRQVYFEFTALGSAVRVAAIDAATGCEVVVTGPANASTADLERLALGRLRAQLDR